MLSSDVIPPTITVGLVTDVLSANMQLLPKFFSDVSFLLITLLPDLVLKSVIFMEKKGVSTPPITSLSILN